MIRFQRSLLPRWAQVTRSKVLREQGDEDDAQPKDCRGGQRSKAPFVRLLPLRSRRRNACCAEPDRCFSSFAGETHVWVALDVVFSLQAVPLMPANTKLHLCRAHRPQLERGPQGGSSRDKTFTDKGIHRAPDCVITCTEPTCWSVPLSPPVASSDAEKLDVLRRLDQFRHWPSLDEKRYCLVCGKIITGHQIQVTGGTRGNGALRINCPTERCHSIPIDWVLPTDEIIAKVEMLAAEERKASLSRAPARRNGVPAQPKHEQHSITSRLRNFASHLTHHS